MKTFFFTLTALITLGLTSCSNEEEATTKTNTLSELSLKEASIDTDVAFIDHGYVKNNNCPNSTLYIKQMEILNFDNSKKLDHVYMIEGQEYSDTGTFNDEIAGDGIYTSVNQFKFKEGKELEQFEKLQDLEKNHFVHIGDKFKYEKDLYSYLNQKYDYSNQQSPQNFDKSIRKLVSATVSFGCKTRWATCPNTSWYNTSLFGEKCIEFYDCDAKIEITIGYQKPIHDLILSPIDKITEINNLALCKKYEKIKL
ncbi:hypothetical protein [Myroides odoratus]|uniref:Lipoprotein n=1 Tax=Myroides odoratus TaxID=256 RepID=A0A378U4N4_MYROD|nr:hypothetical protein [Myroides odoratus]QQU03461.1 hypothetical protein I6I89_16930 [Myroides odoratus]STZ69272.1 Uncharacterised protein [Myroides odoratus]